MRHLLSIDDISTDEIRAILDRGHQLATPATTLASRTVALVFMSPSLRTRVGFTVAAQRLGGRTVDVVEHRVTADMSSPESWDDTLRTVSGMVDLVVCRTPDRLDPSAAVTPVINAGDRDGHPTQALIDLFSIEAERGPVDQLHVALCGDLTQRSARSLLQLLRRMPPRSLVLSAPRSRSDHGIDLGTELESRTSWRPPDDLGAVDVVSMVGFPPGPAPTATSEADRRAHVLTGDRIRRLPTDAVVLSPLPVIDEIDDDARSDARIRMWAQSDRSVAVRMAVLEAALRWRD